MHLFKNRYLSYTSYFVLIFISLSLIYIGFLSLQNTDLFLKYFYKDKSIILKNLSFEDIIFEGQKLTKVSALYKNQKYEVFIRDSLNPRYIAVMFTGQDAGKDAIKYIKDTFHDLLIIAAEYPIDKQKAAKQSKVKTLIIDYRSALINLPLVVKEMTKLIKEKKNLQNIPTVIMGVSFGFLFSYNLAAIDDNVIGIISLFGWSNNQILLESFLKKDISNQFIRKITAKIISWLTVPLEPLTWLKYNKNKPMLFMTSNSDGIIPPECTNYFIQEHPDRKVIKIDTTRYQAQENKIYIEQIGVASKEFLADLDKKSK